MLESYQLHFERGEHRKCAWCRDLYDPDDLSVAGLCPDCKLEHTCLTCDGLGEAEYTHPNYGSRNCPEPYRLELCRTCHGEGVVR